MLRVAICVLLCVACAGCSEDSPSSADSGSSDKIKFRDTKGRQCTTKRFPPIASCDSSPKPSSPCGVGGSPCFIVKTGQLERTDAGLTGPYYVHNCDSCCNQSSSSNVLDDCSPLACTTPSDCAGETAECVGGKCVVNR